MKVVCKIGMYCGKVRDYPPHIARKMLEDGRAEAIGERKKAKKKKK